MKNILKPVHVLSATIIAIIFISVTGCDNSTDPAPASPDTFVGAWEMTTIIMHDTPIGEMTIPAAQFLGMSGTGAAKSVLRFKDDGSASVITTYTDSSQDTISGTWSEDGNNLTVTGAGIDDTVQFKVEGNSLTLTRVMAINFVPDGPKQDIVVDMKYTRIE
ncbi:MAG: lipocalin family protein [Bacteroidetes bacterium]|nr:lipocalin family protein [Bacteroidota bacterium]